ncbi:hypothetical protein POM88_027789 [Heracleum sosnowskyi]|uniref:Uncharacterized protein n=1 Tax=Heracleum sosnowskyi TaxID=360622 RepID=A0AAD8MLS6_9APIA|nr:hypothetical protein POM88_027789 [Heracleum sosnowskyi]
MRDNMRKILSEEKTRADKKIHKNGGDYVNHRPRYLKPKVWEKFCEYWKSDDFQRRSAFAKAARGRVRTPHTSGSITFERRRREYKRKHGEEQDIIEHFKDTHTLRKKKQSDQISKATIDAIIKRYLEICADNGIDPKKTQIQSWIDAVGAKKNKIVGFPKLKAHGPGKAKGKAHLEDDGADHNVSDGDSDDNDGGDGDGGSRKSDGTLRIMD